MPVSETWVAYRRGKYASPTAPTTTFTVGCRNVSHMCGSLIFMSINRCCVWLPSQQSKAKFPREQLQNSSVLYLTSLQSGDIHATSDYALCWVRLHVCRAHRLLVVPETSCFFGHLLLIFPPPPPYASGCICRTKYGLSFHIHYYIPRHFVRALRCVRFRPKLVCSLTPG